MLAFRAIADTVSRSAEFQRLVSTALASSRLGDCHAPCVAVLAVQDLIGRSSGVLLVARAALNQSDRLSMPHQVRPRLSVWLAVRACFGGKPSEGRYAMRGDLVAVASAAECRELVVTNPSYFDLNLPRTAAQIMTLD